MNPSQPVRDFTTKSYLLETFVLSQRFHMFIVLIFEKNLRQNWQTKKSIESTLLGWFYDKKMENHRIDPKGLILAQKG
jgi:hypothetical protein